MAISLTDGTWEGLEGGDREMPGARKGKGGSDVTIF